MNIIAGEPVPPGFEDEVQRIAEIQMAIDKYKGNALIGLEYAVEIYEEDRREPGYLCVLCDKRGDPRTIMQHWTSFNHRLKYLEKHYPSTVREFNPVKYKPNSHHIMNKIVQSLAEAIEDHHGRLPLSVCSAEEFRHMKNKIVKDVNAKHHHDEENGPNFINIIDRTLWETPPPKTMMEQTLQITIKAPKHILNENLASKFSNPTRNDLDEISSDSDGVSPVKKGRKREQSPAYRIVSRAHRSEHDNGVDREKEAEKKLPTPKELSLQASHIAQERYKWEKYRCMFEIQLKQMEKLQKDYEKNPEKHPLYPEEWKKFWNRRYKELQAEKKVDPNKYDYKPEWIVFWTKRMKELFSGEIEKKKKEIKLKLGLPENAEEKIDQLKEKYKVQVSRGGVGGNNNIAGSKGLSSGHMEHNRSREKRISDVIDISDDDDDVRRHRRRRSRSRSRSRSHRSRSFSPRSHSRDYKRKRDSRSRSPPHNDEYDHSTSSYHRRHGSSHTSLGMRAIYPTSSASEEYYAASSRARYLGGPSSTLYNGPQHSHYRVMDSHQYPKYEHSPSPQSKAASATKEEPEPEDDGPLTVVAVLRLLTALEEHLGSLGPKAVDLLGKALALEKVKANSADDLLTNEDNCVFFETIKEKLKGLLIADVIDDHQKIRAVKKAIKNIAAVIYQVNSKGKNSDTNGGGGGNKTTSTTDGSMGAGEMMGKNAAAKRSGNRANIKDLPFDRQVVATKLAAALVIQGREDVSTDDMDKLIYLFILMVKLSKEKYDIDGKPLHTRDILTELGLPVPPAPITKLSASALPSIVDDFLQNDVVSTLVQEAEEEMSNDTSDRDSKMDPNSSMLESLTDSDLQTLLQNFKHLSTEEQHHLVAHLKKLETADPARVEKLRKYVNLTDLTDAATTSTVTAATASSNRGEKSKESSITRSARRAGDESPHTLASGGSLERPKHADDADHVDDHRRRAINISNPNKFSLDDEEEDDDYNFDDVFKAASSNVNRLSEETSRHSKSSDVAGVSSKVSKIGLSANESTTTTAVPASASSSSNALTFNPAGLNISLSDTQNLIANLMGSLQQSNANQNSTNSIKSSTLASNSATIQTINSSSSNQQQQQQQQPQQQPHHQPPAASLPNNMPYYQQQQQQQQMQQAQYPGVAGVGYNQMDNSQGYYNAMGGYNNAGVGYGSYPQWSGGSQQMAPHMQQQFGMQNYMPQQPQQQQPHMGYNMFGRGGN